MGYKYLKVFLIKVVLIFFETIKQYIPSCSQGMMIDKIKD
jgi:hypothetical protein